MKRIAVILALVAALPLSAALKPDSLDARRKALADLLTAQWEWTLSQSPEFASILGDKRWNDKLSDVSLKAIADGDAKEREFLKKFEAIDTTGFPEQERLNKVLMVESLNDSIADYKLHEWLMPVNQMGGIHINAPQFVTFLDFKSKKDYEDYLARLRALPRVMDQTMTLMRMGMKEGLMPPAFLLGNVADQAQSIASQKAEESPFAMPLGKFPDDFPSEQQKKIRAEMLDVIGTKVLPKWAEFAKFVREEYAPKGRKEPGMWSLPDGSTRYATRLKRFTTTDLTPEQIHEIGLKEVARIESEMLVIAKSQGYNDLATFNKAVDANPDLKAKSGQQLLDLYTGYIKGIEPKLPKLFGRMPKASLVVLPVEPFREKSAAAASYEQGTPDGSRPGHVMVNTYDATSRKIFNAESTAYHEGEPGHHFQIAISQELQDLPPFRQQAGYTAFAEGWALYAEKLGKELGEYRDPYSDYGRLNDEMLRAIRLVVDTGLHYKKWSRADVVKYFHDHSALDEVDLQAETDRYIVWPGQACAYKIGQMKISELRAKAEKELGPKFDIRAFHDEVLGAGALPLDVLEQRIDAWIARQGK